MTLIITLTLAPVAVFANTAAPARAVTQTRMHTTIANGTNTNFAIMEDGSLRGWGRNHIGQVGDDTVLNRFAPTHVMEPNVIAVATSAIPPYTMAIRAGGSLWGWGDNDVGQLGDSSRSTSLLPIFVMDNVADVFVSAGSTYAIRNDGSLWAWGRNGGGQLGDGSAANRFSPVHIMDNVVAFSAQQIGFAMAITDDNVLWGWGTNSSNQLGDGTRNQRRSPIQILDEVAAISTASNRVMAIRTDGSLWGWGENRYGQLGDGDIITSIGGQPTPVHIMDDVIAVSVSESHTMAILADGTLWGWGQNNMGQLGDRTTDDRLRPIHIMDDVTSVYTIANTTAVIRTDNSLWTWGCNANGHLAEGNRGGHRPRPEQVMDNMLALNLDTYMNMAIGTDGSLWTWGENAHGQLGNGTGTTNFNPTQLQINVRLPEITTIPLAEAAGPQPQEEPEEAEQPEEPEQPDTTILPDYPGDSDQHITRTIIQNNHSQWAATELEIAYELGLIPDSLSDPAIDLTDPITREEFAGIAVRIYEALGNTITLPAIMPSFTDTNNLDVLKASSIGIMIGISDTQFDPHSQLNREQAATALTRTFKRATIHGWTFATDQPGLLYFDMPTLFADNTDISPWATESVYFMSSHGIIQGIGDNMFAPATSSSREQALIIAVRMLENLQ